MPSRSGKGWHEVAGGGRGRERRTREKGETKGRKRGLGACALTQQYGEFCEAAQYPPDHQLINILPHTRHVIRAHVTHRANRYACNTVRTCERARTAVHAGIGTDPGIGQLHLEHGDSRWSCARKKYVSPRFVLSPSLFLSRPNFSLFLLSNPSSVPVPGKVFAVGRIRYSISYSRNDPIKM